MRGRCDSVRDGDEALLANQAREGREPFSLVVLDLTIPGGLGGREVARKLREAGSTALILTMSGYAEEGGAAPVGIQGQLNKPFTRNDLSVMLAKQGVQDWK